MPHVLINQIKNLLKNKSIASLRSNASILTACDNELPEEVLDQIDAISDTARHVFGPGLKPTIRQEAILRENGLSILPGDKVMSVWRSGKIVTPKGVITYH